jgi:transposase-like protein
VTTIVGEQVETGGSAVDHELGFAWSDPRWLQDEAGLDRRCRAYLQSLRWPDGVHCPRCSSNRVGELTARRKFDCRACRYQFSVTAGTVFHNSHLPLWKWFLTVSVMLSSETGVPSNQLVQLLGGSYKTAWFAQHRVRTAVQQATGRNDCAEDGELVRARSLREAASARREDAGAAARLFERPLVGPYHQVSVKHAHAYVAEMEWRAACRENPSAFRDTVLRLLDCDPVEFHELTKRPKTAAAKSQDR